ncbi:MAG: glycosyltransferase family 9 protein [Candidatus Binatia bacterium]
MSELRRALTDAACRAGAAAFAPIRRRRERELRGKPRISSVLVFNEVRGLGNMVLLSGLLLNLRRLYPGARIAVAMPASPLAPSVLGSDLVDELLCFEPANDARRALLWFAFNVLRPRRFDLGLGTFFSPTLLASCVLAVAGCRYRIAYAQNQRRGFLNTITLEDAGGHELDRHLRLLEFTGHRFERRTVKLVGPQAAREASASLGHWRLGIERPLLGVHPGCDRLSALRRWPIERFVSVIRQVVTAGLADAAVFLGPDEMELRPSLEAGMGPHMRIICCDSIQTAAALIGQCQAFLSNDSGLMHVAAALGVPVVAIFGPTDALKSAPVGSAAVILAAEDVPCRPCYCGPATTCTRDRRYCLEGIHTREVMGAVRRAHAAARWTGSRLQTDTPARIPGHAA